MNTHRNRTQGRFARSTRDLTPQNHELGALRAEGSCFCGDPEKSTGGARKA